MKKYTAYDAAKFAGVADEFKEQLKSQKNKKLDIEENKNINNLSQEIENIKSDFLRSDFVEIDNL